MIILPILATTLYISVEKVELGSERVKRIHVPAFDDQTSVSWHQIAIHWNENYFPAVIGESWRTHLTMKACSSSCSRCVSFFFRLFLRVSIWVLGIMVYTFLAYTSTGLFRCFCGHQRTGEPLMYTRGGDTANGCSTRQGIIFRVHCLKQCTQFHIFVS